MVGRRRRAWLFTAILSCCTSACLLFLLRHVSPRHISTYDVTHTSKVPVDVPRENIIRDISEHVRPNQDTSIISQADLCRKTTNLLLLVVVFSPANHSLSRQIIRETWGSWQKSLGRIRVAFLLGQAQNGHVQEAVLMESQFHGDVIQENFVDSYSNLTLKSLFLLKWTHAHCPAESPAFVMKSDEDTFVNLPRLHDLLIHILLHPNVYPKKGFVFGYLFCGAKPVRMTNKKFYVSRAMYSESVYPGYLAGAGYVMSRSALSPLYESALDLPFFSMEDVFVTGMSRRKAGMALFHHPDFHFLRERPFRACRYTKLLVGHQVPTVKQRLVWKQLQAAKFNCGKPAPFKDIQKKKSEACF